MKNQSEWLTPNQISDMIPSRMQGRNISAQTVRRWQLSGLRGIYLQSVMVGGVRCSTQEQVEKFISDLTERDYYSRFNDLGEQSLLEHQPLVKSKKMAAAERDAKELGL